MKIAKAHGLGNAFLLVPAGELPGDEARAARRLCARHIGVGADGVILYTLSDDGVSMRLLNADGSEAEISGNGLRCLAAYVAAKGWRPPRHVVRTAAGPKAVEVGAVEGGRVRVVTELGAPILASQTIPVALEPAQPQVVDHALDAAGQPVTITATSMGNPHCAVFCESPADDALLRSLGAALESHPFFPRRTNVEFITVRDRGELRVRFWERGVGYTRSSGTGAASAAVAAILTGRVDRKVRVVCDGGLLEVEWPEGGSVRQIGEVELLFEGDWLAAIS
jgi:diaminopimelate epimerase